MEPHIILPALVALIVAYILHSHLTEESLPASLIHPPSNSTTKYICQAYQTLISINPSFHNNPPDLYHHLNIPPTADDGHIVAALKHLTEEHYTMFQTSRGSERGNAERVIAAYNDVGAVLLVAENRAVYDRRVWGRPLKNELNIMCREEWKGD